MKTSSPSSAEVRNNHQPYRKNGVPVDDKDAEYGESDWFAAKPIQKNAQLQKRIHINQQGLLRKLSHVVIYE